MKFRLLLPMLIGIGVAACPATAQTNQTFTYRNDRFLLEKEPPFSSGDRKSDAPFWGSYFWEFGDGHYSRERSPVYHYSLRCPYRSSLRLTPYRSSAQPVTLHFEKKTLEGSGKGMPPTYDLKGKAVRVETNAGGKAIPGHDIRLVIHYRAPDTLPQPVGGYLFLFYNQRTEDGAGEQSLTYLQEETSLYYGEREIPENHLNPTIVNDLKGWAREAARSFTVRYRNKTGFRIPGGEKGLAAGEERRLFLTLRAEAALKNTIGTELQLTALWVPDDGGFVERDNRVDLKWLVQSRHDPFRLRISSPSGYLNRGKAGLLHYCAEFNLSAGPAGPGTRIAVPVQKGMDISSLTIEKMKPQLPSCTGKVTDGCWEKEIMRSVKGDSLVFTIRYDGDGLRTVKGFGQWKAQVPGVLEFSLRSSPHGRFGESKTSATFQASSHHPSYTTQAVIPWRKAGMSLQVGYTTLFDRNRLTANAVPLQKNLNYALNCLNQPLATGWVYGAQFGYLSLHFGKDLHSAESVQALPAVNLYQQRLDFNLHLLEWKGVFGYQVSPRFLLLGAGGMAAPVFGKSLLSTEVRQSRNNSSILREEKTTSVGIFSKPASVDLFDNSVMIQPTIGFSLALGAEAGITDALSIGAAGEARHLRHYYDEESAWILNVRGYLRFRFLSFGR